MAGASRLWVVLLLLSPLAFQATEARGRTHGNPIRKVVNMLQSMAKKVEAEGVKEQELFEKFMCYCKTSGGELDKSIADAKAKIPELESSVEASVGKKTQFEKDLEDHRADKTAAEKAMAEASSLREKESADFSKETAESRAEIAQMAKALASLEGGLASSFLQSRSASELRKVVNAKEEMAEEDRQVMLSFLSGNAQHRELSPVVGILKTMKEEMAQGLSESESTEAEATKTFDALMSAKKKEAKACTKMTEEKLQRVGQLAVELETFKNELADTQACLVEDSKMIATMRKSCATKESEVEKSKAIRQQELVALSDTIKVLNDDDALDLFKKTLPGSSSSFLQIQVTDRAARRRALQELRSGRQHSAQLDFIALALRGKKAGFDEVVKMVDELVQTLKDEQVQDDKKKAYCGDEINKADDKKKGLLRSISDSGSAISKAEEDVVALGEAIKKLTASIKDLDRSVAEATAQRKEEHEEYSSLMASDGTAKELLSFAKNRLNKFYNPDLYKPPAKKQLSEEDSIIVNSGGTAPPTEAPGGVSGTGIGAASFVQVQDDSARASQEKSSGVIALINLLIADLAKEMTEAEVSEKDSQVDYEQAMKDGAAKRAADSKALAESEAEKSDLASDLEELVSSKKSAKKEAAATDQLIMALHSECDWLLQYFDMRKEARVGEVDSLTKARAVLSGADYSFLQMGTATSQTRRFLRHS